MKHNDVVLSGDQCRKVAQCYNGIEQDAQRFRPMLKRNDPGVEGTHKTNDPFAACNDGNIELVLRQWPAADANKAPPQWQSGVDRFCNVQQGNAQRASPSQRHAGS